MAFTQPSSPFLKKKKSAARTERKEFPFRFSKLRNDGGRMSLKERKWRFPFSDFEG